jgi:hypothetical protein
MFSTSRMVCPLHRDSHFSLYPLKFTVLQGIWISRRKMASVSGVCDSTYNTTSDVVLTDGCMVPPSADPHLPGAPSPTASASTSSLVPPVSSMDASCDGSSATTAASQPSDPMQNLEEQWEQIKAVQGLIERCLQQHMNQVRKANTKLATLHLCRVLSWIPEGIRFRLTTD